MTSEMTFGEMNSLINGSFLFDYDDFVGKDDDDMTLLLQRVFLHQSCVQSSRHCARVNEKIQPRPEL